ncbi:MAG: DUF6644 family protein [Acidobacteriota bacterium]
MKASFDFAAKSGFGTAIRDSRYAFPALEMVHLVGLGLLLGSILLFNARFFGFGMRRQTLREVAADFAPWTRLALILMVVSGIPMFAAKAGELWREDLAGFTVKMSLIAVGVVFHYSVQIPLAKAENVSRGRIAATVSLVVWFGAAIAGLTLEFL